MNGPRPQRSRGWQPHLAVPVLLACLLQPQAVAAGVASEAPHSRAVAAALDTISALVGSGDLAAAEARATALLARTENQDGPESLAVASVLDALFQIRKKSQNLRAPEARVEAERSLRIKEARLSRDDPRIEISLNNLGELQQRNGDMKGASAAYERVVEIQRKREPRDGLRLASSLENLGIARRQLGDFTAAQKHFEEALELRREILGPHHLAVARACFHLGIVHGDRGDFDGSRRYYGRALAIQKSADPADDKALARTLSNLAALEHRQGRYAEARSLYEEALVVRERSGDELGVAETLHNFSGLLMDTGDYASARRPCERALEIRSRLLPETSPFVASSLAGLADILQSSGDYAGPVPLYERALAILQTCYPADHPKVTACMSNLAFLLWRTGDPDRAQEIYADVIELRTASLGESHPDVAFSLNHLATLHLELGDGAAAEPLLRRSLDIYKKTLPRSHPERSWAFIDLARALDGTGHHDEARKLYVTGLKDLEAARGPNHPDVGEALAIHAEALDAGGELQRARADNARAQSIFEVALGPEDPRLTPVLCEGARIAAALGSPESAFELALRGEAIARDHFAFTARVLPERRALRYGATRASGLGLVLSFAGQAGPDGPSRAWDALIRSRALVLDEMASRQHLVQRSADPEIAALSERLFAARQRLANIAVRPPRSDDPESRRALLEAARRDKELAERALADRSVEFRRGQTRRLAGFGAVAQALAPDDALVAFVCYEHHPEGVVHGAGRPGDGKGTAPLPTLSYAALLISPEARDPVCVRLGDAARIDAAVERWRALVTRNPQRSTAPANAEHECRRAGEELRDLVWSKLDPYLESANHVFIVPDAALQLVSFAALPSGDGYLVDRNFTLHYLSSERDLLPSGDGAPSGQGLLALGGPDFDADPGATTPPSLRLYRKSGPESPNSERGAPRPCRDLSTVRFQPLPESGVEAEEITRLWRNRPRAGAPASRRETTTLLVGRDASETAFKQMAPGRRVLHLAVHGFFLGDCAATDAGTRGIEALAPGPSPAPAASSTDNPLLRSGLALAGANRHPEATAASDDGLLMAEEIAAMRLGGVDWAVLSACETGLGEIQAGEGVLGLRRAFEVAGVKTLIMSLWPAHDRMARHWMRELYESHWRLGRPTATAVREAMRSTLGWARETRGSTHPYYWAGFVALGDWQ